VRQMSPYSITFARYGRFERVQIYLDERGSSDSIELNAFKFSMLRLSSDRVIEQHLRQAVVPKCQIAAIA